jgi:hypothetical protein
MSCALRLGCGDRLRWFNFARRVITPPFNPHAKPAAGSFSFSAQRELRELFWSFEQATLASGLFFDRRRWISKQSIWTPARRKIAARPAARLSRCLADLNKPASARAAHRRGRDTRNESAGDGLNPRSVVGLRCIPVQTFCRTLPTQRLAQPVGVPTWRPQCTRAAPGPSAHSMR